MRPVLLDTCALIWLANRDALSGPATEALARAEREPGGIVVSPISSWELGQLTARGRLILPMEPLAWFQTALDSGIGLAPMPLGVLVGSSFLPGNGLRDPADRIIAATARTFGYLLMTRDQPLLDFASDGHAHAIAC